MALNDLLNKKYPVYTPNQIETYEEVHPRLGPGVEEKVEARDVSIAEATIVNGLDGNTILELTLNDDYGTKFELDHDVMVGRIRGHPGFLDAMRGYGLLGKWLNRKNLPMGSNPEDNSDGINVDFLVDKTIRVFYEGVQANTPRRINYFQPA